MMILYYFAREIDPDQCLQSPPLSQNKNTCRANKHGPNRGSHPYSILVGNHGCISAIIGPNAVIALMVIPIISIQYVSNQILFGKKDNEKGVTSSASCFIQQARVGVWIFRTCNIIGFG